MWEGPARMQDRTAGPRGYGGHANDRASELDASAPGRVPPVSQLLVLRAGQVFDGERVQGAAPARESEGCPLAKPSFIHSQAEQRDSDAQRL